MKRTTVSGIVGMALFVAASAAFAADKTRSAEAFDRLSSLKGEWKGEIKGIDTTLIYTVTANSSALMEQCRPGKGPEMITMFTGDGDHLIATHYCSAKNRPQMATPAIIDPCPTSTNASAPRRTRVSIDRRQRTGTITCSARRARQP